MSKEFSKNWSVASVLSETFHVEENVSKNIVKMLDEGNTVPFIARYRKEKTKNMQPKEIHAIMGKYEELKKLEEQLTKLSVQIEKLGQMTPKVECALKNCKTEEELTYLAEPFKPQRSRTLAQRGRDKGLEPLAIKILENPHNVDIVKDVPEEIRKEGPDKIEEYICYVIADIIAKDMDVLKKMNNLLERYPAKLECKASKSNSKKENVDTKRKEEDQDKFANYYDFRISVRSVKSFQVLAINRGEAKKALTVKIDFDKVVATECFRFCQMKFNTSPMFRKVVDKAINDAYTRLIAPHFVRSIRSRLKKKAISESLTLFGDNLRQLLMTSPVSGTSILGVDPGFKCGCKLALIGPSGDVIETGIFNVYQAAEAEKVLVNLLHRNNCTLIAIGSGKGARETERLVTCLIQSGRFQPLNVQFCTVNEDGASYYSTCELADKELGWLDVTYRGAVSIARRLQDPLSELVKIPPENLGVGQYQHDLPKKNMENHVSQIMEECISLVGVDLNYAPVHVLEHVSGLNKKQAAAIFDHRRLKGDFLSRDQLMEVKGIGKSTFDQCAGFVRIPPPNTPQPFSPAYPDEDVEMVPVEDLPKTLLPTAAKRGKKRGMKTSDDVVPKKKAVTVYCALDSTIIHPESYDIARKLLADMRQTVDSIGSDTLRDICKRTLAAGRTPCGKDLRHYTTQEKGLQTIIDIIESLGKPITADLREDLFKPLFKGSVGNIESLTVGMHVSGRVQNVAQFGAFVDIGVGQDALLHISKFKSLNVVLGCSIEAIIESIDIKRRRIGLTNPTII